MSLAVSPALPPLGCGILGARVHLLELWFPPLEDGANTLTYGAVGRSKETLQAGASKCPLFVIIIQLVYGLALPPRFVTLLMEVCFPGGVFNPRLPNGLYSLEGLEAVFLVVFLGSEFFQDFLLLF